MNFDTMFAAADVLLLGSAQPVLGTAMLGEAFGTIKSATVVRTGERQMIKDDAQTLRILLINNPGFTLNLNCCFDADVTPPGLLDEIALPYVGVTGRVMEGVSLMWEEGGERGLSIPVASWDSMAGAESYYLNLDGEAVEISPSSPLAAMNKYYVNNLNILGVTGLTGGGSTKLDGLATVGISLSLKVSLSLLLSSIWQTKQFMLVTLATAASMSGGDGSGNADPAAGALIIHPTDYDSGTNDKIWIETD